MVALKRLADAERAGDQILGVILGVGLSNDGRQSGFLAPAVGGQTRAMTSALEQAGLTPADIDYVDCHATGTPPWVMPPSCRALRRPTVTFR